MSYLLIMNIFNVVELSELKKKLKRVAGKMTKTEIEIFDKESEIYFSVFCCFALLYCVCTSAILISKTGRNVMFEFFEFLLAKIQYFMCIIYPH